MRYAIVIEKAEGNYSAYVPDLPGCVATGQTVAEVEAEISVLKGIVSAFLMSHESRRPFYEWQRNLLTELADALLASNGENLDAFNSLAWSKAIDDAQKHRVIVDQIACLTDQSALTLHHRLCSSSAK